MSQKPVGVIPGLGANPQPVSAGTVPWDYNTPFKIITEAGVDAGKLAAGQKPNGQQTQSWGGRLQGIINAWQTQGLKLWLQQDLAFTATQGQNQYNISPTGDIVMPKPMRITEMYWQDSTGARRPLISMARTDWNLLGIVSQQSQGAPNSFYVDKQSLWLGLWIWPTPDLYTATQGQLHFLAQTQVNQITSLTDQLNFPPEWYQALHWALSLDIATGQPQAIIDRCEKQASMWFNMVNDWDVEDADTSFQPDARMLYAGYNFR